MTSNQLPPADELDVVRKNKKVLEERERELRSLLISEPTSRTGNHYVARVIEVERQQVDLAELRAMYPDIVAEHTHARTHTEVILDGITEDGEIISLRKLRTLRIV